MGETVLGGAVEGTPAPAAAPESGGTNSGQQGLSTGGGAAASWRDSLPADLKDDPTLKNFTDVPNLAKAFVHAQSQIGKKGVIVPGEKASDEEWANFYKTVGVPDADKYDIALPKDANVNPEAVKWLKSMAPQLGILPKNATKLLEGYLKFEGASISSAQEAKKQAMATQIDGLKKEWGEGFDSNIQAAKFAAKEIGGDEFVNYLDKSGLGNDVQVIKYIAKVSKLLGEDKLREGGVGSGTQTKEDILSEIKAIEGSGYSNGYYDGAHPNHKVMVDKMVSLRKQITGGK